MTLSCNCTAYLSIGYYNDLTNQPNHFTAYSLYRQFVTIKGPLDLLRYYYYYDILKHGKQNEIDGGQSDGKEIYGSNVASRPFSD